MIGFMANNDRGDTAGDARLTDEQKSVVERDNKRSTDEDR
jgi:hypothetical protein